VPRGKPYIGDLSQRTWLQAAACKGMAGGFDTTKKFDKSIGYAVTVIDTAAENAIEVCIECPVMLQCLKSVLAMEEQPEGIWAGMTQEERVAELTRRGAQAA
jgi:hypothetical protein